MKFKKTLLAFCLIMCIFFCVSSVAAGDVDKTTIANENEQPIMEETNYDLIGSSEENSISSENTPAIEASSDKALSESSESDVLSTSSSSNDVLKSSSTTNSKKTTKYSLSISAPKVTKEYKKNGVFKVTVKDKNTKKPVKGIKLNIKVYTGKKYKTFSQKTDKNGIVKINTKSFAKGTHNVIVTAKATKKYNKKTVKSSIKIKTKSSSSNNKGKISTSITADSLYFTQKNKEIVHRYSYGTFSTYVGYPYISIKPILKGADGKKISGEYEAIVYYYTGNDNSLLKTETFKGKYGESTSYSGNTGGWHYKVVITYNGNSKYAPTKFSRYLWNFN